MRMSVLSVTTMRVLVVFSLLVIKSCVGNEVWVELDQGELLGSLERTFLKRSTYYAFKGVPYAQPPIGSLRFQPPTPHKGWNDTYEALEDKPTCFQFSFKMRNNEPFGISGSEDCLYLSVFTPNLDGFMPVIVFDYNDNFRTGFNGTKTYSPDFFIEENVIVVTIQHRLDIFGYLTTEDETMPSNSGLKDFIFGLYWIQQNIQEFGGDPSRVTLMGNRGGAIIANILMYSERASGLFSGVIMQSGSAMEPTLFESRARDVAFKIGTLLDIQANDSRNLLEELQKIDAETLLTKEGEAINHDLISTDQKTIFPYSPVIDADDGVIAKLPEHGKIVNDVPVMMGLNSREGLDAASHLIFEPRLLTDMVQDYLFLFPIRTNFRFNKESETYKEAIKEIQNFYLEDGYLYYGNILDYAVYLGDILQNYALNKAVKLIASQIESPVYYYMFDYRGQLNENSQYMAKKARSSMGNWGATHSDELCYLHLCARIKTTYDELNKLVTEQPEMRLLKKMVRMWSNFAKTGNPTPSEEDLLKYFIWEPVDKNANETKYLHITKMLRMRTDPLGEREKFWDQFLTKYSEKSFEGVTKNDSKRDEL